MKYRKTFNKLTNKNEIIINSYNLVEMFLKLLKLSKAELCIFFYINFFYKLPKYTYAIYIFADIIYYYFIN